MTFDPFLALPGTQRTRAEVEDELYAVGLKLARAADDSWLSARLEALRWVLGETDTPPLSTGQERTTLGYQRERDQAFLLQYDQVPGDPERGRGVRDLFAWLLERNDPR